MLHRVCQAVVLSLVLEWGLLSTPPLAAQTPPLIGGPFTLVDQDGRAVTERSFHGTPVLLYFGFTSCPDVCPIDLARVARIAQRVRKLGGPRLTPVFVSIDPVRDTPSKMKAYVGLFGPDVVGLTGTPTQIATITDRYHVYVKKVPLRRPGDYMMDHSTFLFLLDGKGHYVDHFGRSTDEAQVAARIRAELAPATPNPRAHPPAAR
jgi:protein SCO1/2